MTEETDFLPWRSALNRISYFIDMLDSTAAYGDFEQYLVKLIKPIYNKLGWEQKPSDTFLDRLLRTSVISFACNRGLPDCVNKAKSYYSQWMSQPDTNPIPSNYRSLVYCTAIRIGTVKEWEFASERYSKETDANQKNDLQSGMSCTKETWLLRRFLDDQLDETKVRKQDSLSGIRAAAVKSFGNALTWKFVKDNWQELYIRYGTGLSFARLIADVASKFNSQSQLDDVS